MCSSMKAGGKKAYEDEERGEMWDAMLPSAVG